MLNNTFECNLVSSYESLTKFEQAALDTFIKGLIQGACVYSDFFTVSDLVGGKFTNWENTPLQCIYLYHKNREGCRNPQAEAGKDMGRIFKYVMAKDKHVKYELTGSAQRQIGRAHV